ncbi:UDP-N-acetylmuramoyl-tripeptide--D-alanyl-D-alanine ligase [Vagococcus fluvialis]|nr:UDP-N-acetylmuramoyl-tripeptide--D-alanyl-D-alanine ligase [Vagococcus fluvialis]HCM89618.1 UDP-N-acetylmuramoyl-tripeptide--D-alanyl-D-alanine ligase [Vagococcus sp.]
MVSEIVKAVDGQNINKISNTMELTSVEFDTRKVQDKTLFVPLKGNRDGHDFIPQAIESGASLVLSDHVLDEKTPYILVEDTLKALQDLASFYLKKVNPKVCGITGSNGKTTTKDMTAAVLSTTFKTYKTQGNYNNEIGLPYTILSMDQETEMLVLEMGMDRKGDIELLSTIAQPDIAAITMIGESHIEFLGSRAGIAEGKMEITAGLKKEGVLLVPENESLLKPLLKEVSQSIQTFGLSKQADLTAVIEEETREQTIFTTRLVEKIETFTIPVLGQYNVTNALIALLIGAHFNVSTENIKKGLAHFDLTKNRTEWLKTKEGIDILSDVYNANPTAMNLVLDSFSKIESQGKKVVVLGDMLELGKDSKEMHESVSEHLNPEKIDEVFLYGSEMVALYEMIQLKFETDKCRLFKKEEKEDLKKELGYKLKTQDTVFLKASNGMGLKEIVDYLLNNH